MAGDGDPFITQVMLHDPLCWRLDSEASLSLPCLSFPYTLPTLKRLSNRPLAGDRVEAMPFEVIRERIRSGVIQETLPCIASLVNSSYNWTQHLGLIGYIGVFRKYLTPLWLVFILHGSMSDISDMSDSARPDHRFQRSNPREWRTGKHGDGYAYQPRNQRTSRYDQWSTDSKGPSSSTGMTL